jgi:hypothetical protein
MIYSEMSKLEKKLIECLNLRLLKQDLVIMQKWDDASSTRESERISIRDLHNMLSDTSDDGYDWEVYDKSFKEYCEQRFGTADAKGILKMLDREEKLKQLGI